MKYSSHSSELVCPGCENRLKEGVPELSDFFHYFKEKYPTLHVSWVHRGKEDQEKAMQNGESNAHFGESKHNSLPSLAVDIFEINENGKASWDAGFCIKVYDEVKALGMKLKNGGDFKCKKTGKSLGDYGHFEVAE
jgi:peptidoglycan L-alanyl-D-glutamate endopeptidase CwlK